MKVVLDTNVVVSGTFYSGIPAQILDACMSRRFELVLSPEILDEYRIVLGRFIRVKSSPDASVILAGLLENAVVVNPSSPKVAVCRDPMDEKFITCALAAGADAIVSGDKDLLVLVGRLKVAVLTPKQFLSRLAPERT